MMIQAATPSSRRAVTAVLIGFLAALKSVSLAAQEPPPCVLSLDKGSWRSEVSACLGEPDLSAVNPAGRAVWIYHPSWMRYTTTVSGRGKQDKLVVVFISSSAAAVETVGTLGPGGLYGIWCPGRLGETVNSETSFNCFDFGPAPYYKSIEEQRTEDRYQMEMEELRLRQEYLRQLIVNSQPPPPPNPVFQMIDRFACMLQYRSFWQKFLYCQ
jgi:hypothetical protein